MGIPTTNLATVFLAQQDGTHRPWPSSEADLESQLRALVDRAHDAWPTLVVDEVEILRHLSAHVTDPGTLGRVHVEDLYLAFGCAMGVESAIRAFEQAHASEMRMMAERLLPPVLAQEVVQILEQQLLVASETREPGIAGFSGQGRLRGWLRVTTVREAVRVRKKMGLEVSVEEDAIEVVGTQGADPELRYMKALYRAEFREALQDAFRSLNFRERTLLRYTVIDGLTVDRIGVIYRVHRATAARWVSQARERLVEETRCELMRRLAVGAPEQESILRMIRSDLNLSIRSLLKEEAS